MNMSLDLFVIQHLFHVVVFLYLQASEAFIPAEESNRKKGCSVKATRWRSGMVIPAVRYHSSNMNAMNIGCSGELQTRSSMPYHET